MIVFFEGETEEQALPILAQKHFNQTPVEMGLDFVGVGGKNSYLPFLMFAENLNIPWVIFSDAEPDAIKCVDKHIQKCQTPKKNEKHRAAKEPKRLKEISEFSEDILYQTITRDKTKYGPAIAEQIIQSDKNLPPKVIELFRKITTILSGEQA